MCQLTIFIVNFVVYITDHVTILSIIDYVTYSMSHIICHGGGHIGCHTSYHTDNVT